MVEIKRFDVGLIKMDPTIGAEIRKTRPCLVISPDSMNKSRLKTVIIAPMTTMVRLNFPTRVNVTFNDKEGQVALDQLRVVDRSRIVKILGSINKKHIREEILNILQVMFSE